MADLSRGYTFGATETVTNAKLHALVDDATVSSIVNADVDNSAAIDGSKIAIDTTGNVLITGTQTITGAKTFSATTALAGASCTGLTVNGDATITGTATLSGTVVMPDVDLTTNVTGALPIANGGSGQATAANAINALLPTQTSNSGKFLTTNGSVASWGAVSVPATIFEWHGDGNMLNSAGSGGNGLYHGTDDSSTVANTYLYLIVDGSTYRSVLRSKYKKTSGISTLSVYAYVKSNNAGGTHYLNMNINGSDNIYSFTAEASYAWKTFNIDVSSLSNGSVYDLLWQMRMNAGTAFCADLIVFGA